MNLRLSREGTESPANLIRSDEGVMLDRPCPLDWAESSRRVADHPFSVTADAAADDDDGSSRVLSVQRRRCISSTLRARSAVPTTKGSSGIRSGVYFSPRRSYLHPCR